MKIRTGRIEKTRLAYLLLSTLLTSQIPLRAEAQAMMEYGGLMAMPKAVPSAGTINTLTNPYRSINSKLMGTTAPGATPAAAGNNSAMSVDALGTVTLDPKKAQILGAKALKQFEQAKAKVAAHPADLMGAEVLMRQAIDTRNSIWGYSDPIMPTMLNLMGEIYAKQKHVPEAEACFKNALIYITKKQGSGSFDRVDTLSNLGNLYSEHNPKEAVNYFQQVAQIRERQSGATSLATLKAKLQWANASASAGRSDTGSLYQALIDSVSRADKTKSGYSEVQTSLVKDYGAFLKKEGRGDEVAGLESRFTTPAGSGAIPEIISAPVAAQTTNAVPPQTAIPTSVMPVPAEKEKEEVAAPATPTSSGSAPSAEMTIEEKLRAEAAAQGKLKKGKGKLEL